MATSTHFRTCPLCEATCGLEVEVADGEVRRIRGDREDVFSKGFLCPKGFSAVTKTWCTEFEQHVAEFCVRVAGPQALEWNRVSRGLCYSPAYTVMGGTTSILRNIVGERILGLPKEPGR